MNGITEFHRRYEVQIANTITTVTGRDMQGSWVFHLGFHLEPDAVAAAELLSEDNRWVRVVDTQAEGACSSTQCEPSATQTESALEAFAHRDGALANRDDMIAALRAAWDAE